MKDDEFTPKELEYETKSNGMSNIKKTLMWIVPLVVIIIVVFIIINHRSGDDNSEYTELISKANAAFNLEEYLEAKENYQAALTIKPDAAIPLDRIGIIDSILTSREEERIKVAAEEEISTPSGEITEKIPPAGESEKTKPSEAETPPAKISTPETPAEPAGGGKYHIVVGCFGNKSNAVNYSKKLIGKGLNSRIIPILDGTMSAVTYQSFATEKEAFIVLRQVQSDFAKEAWVIKY